MKNDHLWFGVCFRDYGTNYSGTQRILVMMVRFLTTMSVAAIFHGVRQDSTIGDLTLAFIESMLGFIPMKFIEDFMKQFKPSKIDIDMFKINKTKLDSKHVQKLEEIRSASVAELIAMLCTKITSPTAKSPATATTPATNAAVIDQEEWLALVVFVKQRVLRKLYKYPKCCRKASKIIAITWTVMAATIVYYFAFFLMFHYLDQIIIKI